MAISTIADSSNRHRRRNGAEMGKQNTRSTAENEKKSMKESHEKHDIEREFERDKRDEINELWKKESEIGMSGGRRRSFWRSETELDDFFACSGVKVMSVDMPPFMQIHAVDCARKAYDSLEKFTAKTLASTLKKGV